jgi:hypothetical protein
LTVWRDLKDGASEGERVGVAEIFSRKLSVTKSLPAHIEKMALNKESFLLEVGALELLIKLML